MSNDLKGRILLLFMGLIMVLAAALMISEQRPLAAATCGTAGGWLLRSGIGKH